jgi:hypothetical protein
VAAALGGLIGSIIGYYFGESAGRAKGLSQKDPQPAPGVAVQKPDPGGAGTAGVTPVEKPKVG